VPLISRDENELLVQQRQFLTENTPITNFSPGSTVRMIAEVVSRQQAETVRIVNTNVLQAFISRASGEFLDRVGELLGVERLNSSYAIDTSNNNFKFQIDPSTGMTARDVARIALDYAIRVNAPQTTLSADSFTIRSGTPLGGRSGSSLYSTTEEVVFMGTDTEKFAGVIANGLGASFNVGANALTKHQILLRQPELTPVADVIICTNTQPITSGRGLESDQDLRFRIRNAARSAEAANETAVRLACLSVPGVNDIVIKNYARGVGTFNIFVIGDTAVVPEGILRATQQAVNSIQALGIRGLVTAPEYKGMEMTIRLKFLSATSLNDRRLLKDAATQVAVDYVNNIPTGGLFVLNELVQRVMQSSDSILDMDILRMAIGVYDTKSAKNERSEPVIATNQQAYWDEKWYTNSRLTKTCE